MIRRDARNVRQPFLDKGEDLGAEEDGVDEMDYVGLELLQAPDEAWTHKV